MLPPQTGQVNETSNEKKRKDVCTSQHKNSAEATQYKQVDHKDLLGMVVWGEWKRKKTNRSRTIESKVLL